MKIRRGSLFQAFRRITILCYSLLLGACTAVPQANPPTYLHILETHVSRGVDPNRPLRVAVRANEIQKFVALLDPEVVIEVGSDEMIVDLSRYPVPAARAVVSSRYSEPSFVIDYDSPSVEAWATRVIEESGTMTPSLAQIKESVRTGIEVTSARGFDFASTVARDRRGDCTEHAVLFAALARRFGYSTRVVFGTVIVAGSNGQLQAFGHAWNEVLNGEGWSVFDATDISGDSSRYIPGGYLENEGPGYARSLAARLIGGVRSIHVLGNAAPARSR